jgi:hypothetical protein
MPETNFFSAILYSKIRDKDDLEVYLDNIKSFFANLKNPELVKFVYLVDDSSKDFEIAIKQMALESLEKNNFKVKLVEVLDNGSIYTAFDRVWSMLETDYAISFNSDHRLVQELPLGAVLAGLERYPEIYEVLLMGKIVFGYNNLQAKKEFKKLKPYYKVFRDDEMTTWFCFNEKERKVFSIPCKLKALQESGKLAVEAWGNEIVPLIVDDSNNFWITKRPPRFLKGYYTNHEAFTGNPAIVRVKKVKQYMPLPKRYKKEGPAECQEMYFRRTSIDCRNFVAYFNLQAFTVSYKDFTKPLGNIEKEYWEEFTKRNSVPFTYKNFNFSREEAEKNGWIMGREGKMSPSMLFCLLKSYFFPRFEELAIAFFGKDRAKKIRKKLWYFFRGSF